jgi:probable phosphoglycerate mutase
VQGSGVDAELNETGMRQAQAFFEAYKHINFDKIYTSKLKRTHQSVKNFLALDIPHEAHAGLNEISWGKKEGHRVTAEDDEHYFYMLKQWREGVIDMAIEGGESPLEVAERQKPVLDLILSRVEEETILICMHGRAIRILLCLIFGLELQEMDKFEHSNLCLYQLLYQDGKFILEKENDIEHLKELRS